MTASARTSQNSRHNKIFRRGTYLNTPAQSTQKNDHGKQQQCGDADGHHIDDRHAHAAYIYLSRELGEYVYRLWASSMHEKDNALKQVSDREGRDQERRTIRFAATQRAKGKSLGENASTSSDGYYCDDQYQGWKFSNQRRRHVGGGRHHQRVGAEHDQITLREIDHAHNAENQSDAERDERVLAPEAQGIHHKLNSIHGVAAPPK